MKGDPGGLGIYTFRLVVVFGNGVLRESRERGPTRDRLGAQKVGVNKETSPLYKTCSFSESHGDTKDGPTGSVKSSVTSPLVSGTLRGEDPRSPLQCLVHCLTVVKTLDFPTGGQSIFDRSFVRTVSLTIPNDTGVGLE